MNSENQKIPRMIHYCWFGRKEKPKLAEKCIASWKKLCPDFQIIEWNEDNFDVRCNTYVEQAYEKGKYAFVSDYARMLILEQYGGIYFDVDVELLKPIGCLIDCGAYMACEEDGDKELRVNPGLGMAVEAHSEIIRELLAAYEHEIFCRQDGTLNQKTIVERTTEVLIRHGLKPIAEIQKVEEFNIYPRKYCSPQHYRTGKTTISKETVSNHHYSASWYSPYEKFVDRLSHVIGKKWTKRLVMCKKKIKKVLGR